MNKPADPPTAATPPDGCTETARCDYCGENRLVWRKCKLICESCGNINKSCADL